MQQVNLASSENSPHSDCHVNEEYGGEGDEDECEWRHIRYDRSFVLALVICTSARECGCGHGRGFLRVRLRVCVCAHVHVCACFRVKGDWEVGLVMMVNPLPRNWFQLFS